LKENGRMFPLSLPGEMVRRGEL